MALLGEREMDSDTFCIRYFLLARLREYRLRYGVNDPTYRAEFNYYFTQQFGMR